MCPMRQPGDLAERVYVAVQSPLRNTHLLPGHRRRREGHKQ